MNTLKMDTLKIREGQVLAQLNDDHEGLQVLWSDDREIPLPAYFYGKPAVPLNDLVWPK